MSKMKDFFEYGNFIVTLKDSLEEVNTSLSEHKSTITKLQSSDIVILEIIKHLKDNIQSIDQRISRIEDKLMNIDVTTIEIEEKKSVRNNLLNNRFPPVWAVSPI